MDSGWTVDEEPYFEDEREASKSEYATLRHAVEGPPSLPAYRNAPVKLEPAQSYAPSRPLMFGPNIIGRAQIVCGNLTCYGAFEGKSPTNVGIDSGTGGSIPGLNFSASLSSDLYGRAQTTQPASIRLLPCVKI